MLNMLNENENIAANKYFLKNDEIWIFFNFLIFCSSVDVFWKKTYFLFFFRDSWCISIIFSNFHFFKNRHYKIFIFGLFFFLKKIEKFIIFFLKIQNFFFIIFYIQFLQSILNFKKILKFSMLKFLISKIFIFLPKLLKNSMFHFFFFIVIVNLDMKRLIYPTIMNSSIPLRATKMKKWRKLKKIWVSIISKT